MFINYEMATIEITKAEAKEAGKYGSEMYLKIADVKAETGFTKVFVKENKRRTDTMKGLTYAYMTVYIEKKAGDRKDELMATFNEFRGCIDGKRNALAEKASYGEVKAWFLEQFSEITTFNETLNNKRTSLREERELNRLRKMIA